MKNFINYYYGFDISNISFINGKYFFNDGKNKYMLKLCENPNITTYYPELILFLEKSQYFAYLVKNREDNYLTWIDHKPYILLKLSNIKNDKITIFDIKTDMFLNVTTKLAALNRFPWIQLWQNKIDYFEEWLSLKPNNYKKVYALFHYFIGIAENALLYVRESEYSERKEESDTIVVAHDRITIEYSLYDYYDPSNIILDHASRDISEYIKSMFLHRMWDLDVIKQYLEKHYFSKYGFRMLYARIVFPSFFFDYLEKTIMRNNDIDLLHLENRVNEFQLFIKNISVFFQENYHIPVIPWIIKET